MINKILTKGSTIQVSINKINRIVSWFSVFLQVDDDDDDEEEEAAVVNAN